jgi:hypothetical protein
MENKKEGIPCIFYLYLHSKLLESTENNYITTTEAEWKMFQWKIPKNIRPLILKEMEILGLLNHEGRRLLKLNKSEFKIDDINKYSTLLNIF